MLTYVLAGAMMKSDYHMPLTSSIRIMHVVTTRSYWRFYNFVQIYKTRPEESSVIVFGRAPGLTEWIRSTRLAVSIIHSFQEVQHLK